MALCKRLLDWLDTKTALRLVQMFPLWSYVLSNHRQKLGQWDLRSSFYSIKESTNQDSKWIDAGQVNQSSMKVKICVSSEVHQTRSKRHFIVWYFTIWIFFENYCRILFSAMKSQLNLRFLWATSFEIFHDSCLISIHKIKICKEMTELAKNGVA